MSEVIAIAAVRLRLLINRMRSRSSKGELALAAIMILLGVVASLGVASLVGMLMHSGAASQEDGALHGGLIACFLIAGVAGVLMPIMLSSGASGLDTSQLTIFPVRRRRLFLISWASAFLSTDQLVYYPILVAGLYVLQDHGALGGLGGLLTFITIPLLIVTWSFALLALIQGVLKHRRSKEIAGMVGFALFITISFLPTWFAGGTEARREARTLELVNEAGPGLVIEEGAGSFEVAMAVLAWTPPGLAADGIELFAEGDNPSGVQKLILLAVWLLAGLGVGYAVFLWRMRNNLGATQSGTSSFGMAWLRFDATKLFPFLPLDLVGVASRELRYVFRSSVGKLNVLLVPMVCGVLLMTLGRALPALAEGAPSAGIGSESAILFGLTVYGLLFTNNFVNNSVGWEGVGFKSYLLSPVPLNRVLLGKNLGIWIYATFLYGLIIATWSVLREPPSFESLYQTFAFFSGSLLVFTASGNFASILFPIPRDISAMKSQPSHPAVLCSLVTVLCLGGAILFLLAMSVTVAWMRLSLSLSIYFVGAAALYWASLPHAARLFHTKSERILAKLEAGL